jgi:glycosyltransferase involved in cell wall biosynthesis
VTVAVVGGDARVARALTPPWRARVVSVASAEEAVAAARGEDLALLAGDAVPAAGWLDALADAAYGALGEGVGLVAGLVLGADGRIESAGVQDAPGRGEGRRFAGAPASLPAAHALQTVLGADPACLYVTSGALAALGGRLPFDPYDLWERGLRAAYTPHAVVRRTGPAPAPLAPGPVRRGASRGPDGARRIVYVTQDTGMGGGHRVVFDHLDGLRDRGHDTELWTLAPEGPDWYDLRSPVRWYRDYPSLMRALRDLDAVKVATWWESAAWVWEASVTRGTGVFFVQDIETTYYREAGEPHEGERRRVLASYRPEFRFLATSHWVGEQLERLQPGGPPELAPPGIEDRWFAVPALERRDDVVLGLGRSNPLKNFPLTRDAYLALPEPRPELWLFGGEPELGEGLGDRVTYHVRPSDAEVAGLLARAAVFVQTSSHEGYCLPIVEAMAAGVPVVCTDAHGNRDFCADGVNCLMPDATPEAVAAAIARLLADPALRERLVAEGRRTAEAHRWGPRLDALDAYFRALD